MDICYLVGLLIIWAGNILQIHKIIKTKSTKSLSMAWLWALTISIIIRLPRAVTSTYWAWSIGYIISTVICVALLVLAIIYRKKYPKK